MSIKFINGSEKARPLGLIRMSRAIARSRDNVDFDNYSFGSNKGRKWEIPLQITKGKGNTSLYGRFSAREVQYLNSRSASVLVSGPFSLYIVAPILTPCIIFGGIAILL